MQFFEIIIEKKPKVLYEEKRGEEKKHEILLEVIYFI